MDTKWAFEIRDKIVSKYKYVSEKNIDRIPYTVDENGNYDDKSSLDEKFNIDDGINWWTNGFWSGINWLLYQVSEVDIFKEAAVNCENKLDRCFEEFLGLHHDVGFMFMPSSVSNYRITKNEKSKIRALHAANILAGRFNIAGNYIRAWNDLPDKNLDTRGWAIIDCMFNITLLYWASEETKDCRYKKIAMAHADTVMKNFIREDGSSIHIGEFDPDTGIFIRNLRGQGYDKDSAWSRGQGWALYGFTISYIKTGKKEYLDTAIKVADFCINRMGDSLDIPVDFKQPKEPSLEDNCGACVIAAGLIELSRVSKLKKYEEYGVNLLRNIAVKKADFTMDCDAIVKNCSAEYHTNKHHIYMNYADYYFIEAILKITNPSIFMW